VHVIPIWDKANRVWLNPLPNIMLFPFYSWAESRQTISSPYLSPTPVQSQSIIMDLTQAEPNLVKSIRAQPITQFILKIRKLDIQNGSTGIQVNPKSCLDQCWHFPVTFQPPLVISSESQPMLVFHDES
jgi:hypothetical protein